jgi:hypothetical protein
MRKKMIAAVMSFFFLTMNFTPFLFICITPLKIAHFPAFSILPATFFPCADPANEHMALTAPDATAFTATLATDLGVQGSLFKRIDDVALATALVIAVPIAWPTGPNPVVQWGRSLSPTYFLSSDSKWPRPTSCQDIQFPL